MMQTLFKILLLGMIVIGCSLNTTVPRKETSSKRVEKPQIKDWKKRYNFIGSEPLFWFSLTPFEKEALQKVELARQGNPEALLAFSLIAGAPLTEKQFVRYQTKLHHFLQQMHPRLNRVATLSGKGNLLHKAMHQTFFSGNEKDLSGYEIRQTELTQLLDTGKYNCMSSAVLYMYLARSLNWRVQGVELPSHVFLQIISPEYPRPLEVETTSYTGFEWIHDQQYYQNENKKWSHQRGLKQATFEDYLKRKIIEPHVLVAKQMTNFIDRLDLEDQKRMQELRAFLHPENRAFQLARLRLYSKEYSRLSKQEGYPQIVRMFDTIHPVFKPIETRWPKDPEILNMLALLKWEYARSLDKMNDSRAVRWIRQSLLTLPKETKYYEDLLSNNLTVWRIHNQRMIQKKDFRKAEALSLAFFKDFSKYFEGQNRLLLSKSIAHIYEEWALSYANQEEWGKAIEKYRNRLAWTAQDNSEDRKRVKNNILILYKNLYYQQTRQQQWHNALTVQQQYLKWASQNNPENILKIKNNMGDIYAKWGSSYFKKEDWKQAIAAYQQALHWLSDKADRHQTAGNMAAAFRNWSIQHTQEAEWSDACQILKQCVLNLNEFPPDSKKCQKRYLKLAQAHQTCR